MKSLLKIRILALVALVSFSLNNGAFSQSYTALPTDNENVFVSMELQGVLDLTLVTSPNLDFVFSTIPEYMNGIIKTNATELRVEATVAWDLAVSAETENWEVFEEYSQAGNAVTPSSIIGVRAIDAAGNSLLDGSTDPATQGTLNDTQGTGSSFTNFTGTTPLPIIGDVPGVDADTDFPGAPGSYLTNPDTHQFRVDYKLSPGLSDYRAGYYGINIVYTLAEDL